MLGLAIDIFLGPGMLAAVVASLGVVVVAWRLMPASSSEQFALALAVATAFFIGYVALLGTWSALRPEQSWQWLPYVGLIAAGGAATLRQITIIRWLTLASVAIIAAGMLTPRWPIFGLPWPISIVALSAFLVVITATIEICPPRRLIHTFVGLLALAAALVAVAAGAEVSIRFGQLAAVSAAGLAGCWVAASFTRRPTEQSLRGLSLVYAVLVGGLAFTACVEPEQPIIWLLIMPLLPLAACPFARRTIS